MKISKPFVVRKRSDTGKWEITINPISGVDFSICTKWQRKSFENFPSALAAYRNPTSEAKATQGAIALVEYLKRDPDEILAPKILRTTKKSEQSVGDWIRLFLSIETSPRAARLVARNQPYSPDTIELYNTLFRAHIDGDPFLREPMNAVAEKDILSYLNRLSLHRVKGGRYNQGNNHSVSKLAPTIGGTRTFVLVFKFIRMTFNEYGKQHLDWIDPFRGIDTPKPTDTGRRDGLDESEIARIFSPGVLATSMERAVAAAMFWAGLRRSEIFALTPDDLNWDVGRIVVNHAWKQFDRTKNMTLGTTKSRKARITLFPDILQESIKKLWEENGKHDFVFCFADGTIPNARWFSCHVEKWFKLAGIDLENRKVTPHSARHSLASILEAQGTPLRYVQELLGHSDLKTTFGYLHTPQDAINQVTKRINSSTKSHEQDISISQT